MRLARPGCVAGVLAIAAAVASAGSAEAALRIYSSQPLFGSAQAQGRDLIAAERLALSDAGGRVGGRRIAYRPMNDATLAAGRWDPEQVAANAQRALRDPRAIAYLGEYNSAASAISIPIINQGRLLQVSPANSAEQFTLPVPEDPGSPGKYYPTGIRTYARVVPVERVQAAAQAAVMQRQAVTRLYVINDRSVDGQTISGEVASDASLRGIGVAGFEAVDAKTADPTAVAARIVASGANALFFGGTAQDFAIRLWQALYAASPGMALFGPDGIGDDTFAAAIGPGPGARTTTTAVPLARSAYPPLGRRFFTRFQRRFGRKPESYAIYGYEAMKLVLRAIAKAGDDAGRRTAVVRALLGTRVRRSVLGNYSINRSGDTTLADYGVYGVRDARLVFEDKVVVRLGG